MQRQLIAKALNFLSRREYSRRELLLKLEKFTTEKELIITVLDYLQQQNYQSDQRFVESYVRTSILSGYGPMRIKYKIQQKGISCAEIEEYLANLEINWQELAHQQILRKFGNKDLKDRKVLAKIYNFLYLKGFGQYIEYI